MIASYWNLALQRLAQETRLIVLALLVFAVDSCAEKSTQPLVTVTNPRAFSWTIDTIAYPGSFQTMMQDIWGSGPQNVYIVGHNDQNVGLMWRFNGNRWTNVMLASSEGGNIDEAIGLTAIVGTAPNDIWAVGTIIDFNPQPPPTFIDSSLIVHFDGSQWLEQRIQRGGWLNSVSASGPRDAWACGSNRTLYHYEGTSWIVDSIPIPLDQNARQQLYSIKVRNVEEVFALGANVPGRGDTAYVNRATYYFLKRAQGHWTLVSSFSFSSGAPSNRFGVNGLWVSPQGTLYSFDANVFRWSESQWLMPYQSSSALRRMAGKSDNDFFVVGDFGKVLHYNGVDWYEFTQLRNSNAVYSSVWVADNEVFIVGYLNDGSKTLILHGK